MEWTVKVINYFVTACLNNGAKTAEQKIKKAILRREDGLSRHYTTAYGISVEYVCMTVSLDECLNCDSFGKTVITIRSIL